MKMHWQLSKLAYTGANREPMLKAGVADAALSLSYRMSHVPTPANRTIKCARARARAFNGHPLFSVSVAISSRIVCVCEGAS